MLGGGLVSHVSEREVDEHYSSRPYDMGQASADRGIRVMVTDPSESILLSGHRGGAIHTWPLRSLPDMKPQSAYKAHTDGIVAATLLPGVRQAASCDQDGALHVWDLERAATLEARLVDTVAWPLSSAVGAQVWRDGVSQAANQRRCVSPIHRPEDVLPYVALADTSDKLHVRHFLHVQAAPPPLPPWPKLIGSRRRRACCRSACGEAGGGGVQSWEG
jgi:hypothetical protein